MAALKETPWQEAFGVVADWLESVDDLDHGILLHAARELERRATGQTREQVAAARIIEYVTQEIAKGRTIQAEYIARVIEWNVRDGGKVAYDG